MAALYKITLKTDAEDREELVQYCLDANVLGVGWGSHYFRNDEPKNFDDYYAGAVKLWGSRELGPVRHLHDAEVGSLVWFRDRRGHYYLARLVGPWRLLYGAVARRNDLGNIRDVEYALVGTAADVPGAVLRGYAAPRQWSFCRVNDDAAHAYSALLASELLGSPPPEIHISTRRVLTSLLGYWDVEDLVAAFLQDTRDYVALPARHSPTNAVYEYVLKHRRDGHVAAVQVKTGDAEINVDLLSEAAGEKWFVYSSDERELPSFVERISEDDLVRYMESRAQSLPPVVERWMARVG